MSLAQVYPGFRYKKNYSLTGSGSAASLKIKCCGCGTGYFHIIAK